MSKEKEERLRYLTSLGKIALFYFLGLSLFFIAGFIIITFRVSVKREVVVPDLIGHMFLEEFNRIQNLGLKLHVEPYHSIQFPYGYILAQSLGPGQVVKEGTKLSLIVNFSETVVEVPQLVGQSFELVESMLSNLPAHGRPQKLPLGIVVRVPSQEPQGEVLEQFPPPGSRVIPNTPVHLLVSDGMSQKSSLTLPTEALPLNLAGRFAYELKIPLALEIESTLFWDEEALVSLRQEKDHLVGKLKKYSPPQKKGFSLLEKHRPMPFSYYWIKAKNVKEGDFTLKIYTPQKSAMVSYLYLWGKKVEVPVFVRLEEKIELYPGYFMSPDSEKEGQEGSTKAEKIYELKAGEI
ncbi:MAG: PASTA domain-containing protein [Leptospiraceae bacterium]|nr:PASTA domain-containing protein [Leptospiraceae bacterium]